MSDDGAAFLASAEAGDLLAAAVAHAGGDLLSWELDHIDNNPQLSTTATFAALVAWPYGRREELLGVSARADGISGNDSKAEIFADGERQMAVWLYPHDPDLPGLARAAYDERPSVYGADALGWSLTRAGRAAESWTSAWSRSKRGAVPASTSRCVWSRCFSRWSTESEATRIRSSARTMS